MRTLLRSAPAAVLLAAAACGGRAVAGEAAGEPPLWRLSEPTVSIGLGDGDPDYQLYQVAAALRLEDGRIVVLNRGHASLSVFDAEGRFLHRAGRRGQGPGEFEVPGWAGRMRGDTVAVWDQRLRRTTFFTPDGTLVRVAAAGGVEGMFPEALGVFGDGSLAVTPGPDVFAMRSGDRGLRRDPVRVQRLAPDGSPAGPLAEFPGKEVFVVDRDGSGFAWNDAPFGRESFAVVAGERLYVAEGGSGEVAVYSSRGERIATLHAPHAPWRVDPADAAAYRRSRLAAVHEPERRRELQATLDAAEFPETSPALGGLQVDPDGNLWVQVYPRPLDELATWTVLAPDGTPIGRVEVPRGLRLTEVGRHHVMGISRDELGVERVVLHSLAREERR
jgi:hypothetical protein